MFSFRLRAGTNLHRLAGTGLGALGNVLDLIDGVAKVEIGDGRGDGFDAIPDIVGKLVGDVARQLGGLA